VFKLRHLPFYGAELKAYDLLSGKAGIGATRLLGPQRVREMLPTVGPCVTANTPMLSAADDAVGTLTGPAGLYTHGSEAAVVASFPRANCELALGLTEAIVRFAVRHEFAHTINFVLAGHSRLLLLDARPAAHSIAAVADVMVTETATPSHRVAVQ
jgi:glycerol-3-phosphate dehydrogenase